MPAWTTHLLRTESQLPPGRCCPDLAANLQDLKEGKEEKAEPTGSEAAAVLAQAKNVIIIPGYGMALAQAQHLVKNLADALEARGAEVKYAIHPVAGRMPGHMNVLLSEADVPYDQLYELEQINDEFARPTSA